MFEKHLEENLRELSQQSQRGTYCPQACDGPTFPRPQAENAPWESRRFATG
jgi:hypothetical protein